MYELVSRSIKLALPLTALFMLGACANAISYTNKKNADNGKAVTLQVSGYNYFCQPTDPHSKCDGIKKEYDDAMASINASSASDGDKKAAEAALVESLGFKYGRVDTITNVKICGSVKQSTVCESLTPPTPDQGSEEFGTWLTKAIDEFAAKIEYYPESTTPNTFDPNVPVQNMIIQNIQNSLPVNGSCTLTYNHVTHGYVCI